jgi:hypothetical protein
LEVLHLIWIKRSLFGSVKKTVWLGFLVILALVIFQHKEVQAVFGIGIIKQDVEMSPEIKGRLTEDGVPLSGVTITRRFAYEGYKKGEEQLDYSTTDANGAFSFPELIIKSRYPKDIFGQNALVKLRIYYEQESSRHYFWFSNSSYAPFVEPIAALLQKLKADLKNKQVKYQFDTSPYSEEMQQIVSSICYFEGYEDVAYFNGELISSFSTLTE